MVKLFIQLVLSDSVTIDFGRFFLITDFLISAGDPQDYYVSPTLGLMFFSATTNAAGREMHYVATDDDEGVYNETNIGSGDGIRAGTQFIEYNGDVYFTATNGTSGYELWRTNHLIDGSPLTMVKDINATGDSNPVNFIVFGGKLIFQANDGIHGAELWQSDGTTSGTTLVTDINTGVESSSPAGFVALNSNVLLFTATEATVGAELWKLNNSGLSNTTSDFDENSIQIYPNPATNEINVSNTRNSGISTITIMDVNGRTIKQNTFNNFSNVQVNIAELSKGVYLMKINLEAGIVTKRIVKN